MPPLLVYPTGDFQPFTKILSSEVNGKFNSITTLLNTTKLNYVNLQTDNIMYATQLTNQVAITNTLGQLTTTPILPATNGGLGFSFTASTLNANLVVQSNSTGSALTLLATVAPPTEKIYMLLNYI